MFGSEHYIHVLAFRNLLLEDNMGGEEKTCPDMNGLIKALSSMVSIGGKNILGREKTLKTL